MNRRKNWFRVLFIVFVILLGYASYDIGRRTTFPGSKPQLKQRIEDNFLKEDSARVSDTPDTSAISVASDTAAH